MKYFNNFLCNKDYYSQRCATVSCVSNQATFTTLFITLSLSLLRLFKFIFALAFIVFLAACTDDKDDAPQLPTAPGVPDAPSVVAINSTAIDISWDMVSGATYYEIWQDGAIIGSDITSLTATDVELIPNTLYSYSIKACNASGCSAISVVASARTLATDSVIPTDSAIPSIPLAPTVTVINSTAIYISWDMVSGATYYEIWQDGVIIGSDITSLAATDIELTPNTLYEYSIKACNASGCSALSVVASARTPATDPAIPSTPRDLTVTALTLTSLNISWDAVMGASIYKVTQVIPLPKRALDLINAPQTERITTSLLPDTTYGYTVQACSADAINGCSAPSTPVYGTTHPEAPTSSPSGLTVAAQSSTSLRISWEGVAKATHYEIFNATEQPRTLIANISAPLTNHIVDGLIERTSYTYFVRACNMAGCGEYAFNSATTSTDNFAAPKIRAVRANPPFALNISWQPQGAVYYQVISDRFPVIRVDAPTNYTVVTGLLPGTIYYYTIRSCMTKDSCVSSYQGSGITSSLSHVTVKLAWVDQLELPAFNGYMGILNGDVTSAGTDDAPVIPPMLVDPVNDPTQQRVYINSLASRLSLVGVSFDTTEPVSESNLNGTNFLETKFSLADANLFNSGWDEDHRFARNLSEVAGGVFFANTNSSDINAAVIRPANRMDLQSAGVERYLRLAALGDGAYDAGEQNAILGYTSTLPLRARYNSTVRRANKDEINAIDDLIAVNISGVTEDVTVVARMCALPEFSRNNANITCAEPALPAAMELSNILLLDGYWKTAVDGDGDTDTNCLGGAFNPATHFCDIQGMTQPALNPATNMPFGSVTNVTAAQENRVVPLYIRQYINRRADFNSKSIDDYSGITKLADDDSLNEDGYYLITIQALNSEGTRVSNQLKMIFETKVE